MLLLRPIYCSTRRSAMLLKAFLLARVALSNLAKGSGLTKNSPTKQPALALKFFTLMYIGALPRRYRPQVTHIGIHGALNSRSAIPWRLTRNPITVVSRTELAARGSSVPQKCKTAHLGKTQVARPRKAMNPRVQSYLPGKFRTGHEFFSCQ